MRESGKEAGAISSHPLRIFILSCAVTTAFCAVVIGVAVQRATPAPVLAPAPRVARSAERLPRRPLRAMEPLPAVQESERPESVRSVAAVIPAESATERIAMEAGFPDGEDGDPDDDGFPREQGAAAVAPPPVDLADFARSVRNGHVDYYGERLGLSAAQREVLDRLIAERQVVPANPRLIVRLPEVLATFRQYLRVDQVLAYDSLLAGDP